MTRALSTMAAWLLVAFLASPSAPLAAPPSAAASVNSAPSSTPRTNLINNGDFELGNFTNWQQNGGMVITTSPVHSGSYAAQTTGGWIQQSFPTTPGTIYKVTAWIYYISVTGGTWGGPRVWTTDPIPTGWVDSGGTNYLQGQIQPNLWTKIAFSFTPTQTSNLVNVGNYGDRTVNVVFDDVEVFAQPATNTLPTVSIGANTTSVTSLQTPFSFTSIADDYDGAVSMYFWDFGDGGKSNLSNPTYAYAGNGTYSVTLTVFDDSGGMASAQMTVAVLDPTYPSMVMLTPVTMSLSTSSPSVNFSGTAIGGLGAAINAVTWSTDRDQVGTASGTSAWNFTLNLANQGGRNRVTVDAVDANGHVARQDVLITYLPPTPVSIVNGAAGVTENSSTIQQYEKFEATFNLQNFVASNPYFPYNPNSLPGMIPGTGVSVLGFFLAPSGRVYHQPGFYYQPYTRNAATQQLIATGSPVWKLRFAPSELGTWTFQVSILDGSGTTTLTDPSLAFTVVAPTNSQNHGFVRASPSDPRYFAFDDGTPYVGVGPGASIQSSFSADTAVAQVGLGGANLTRTWMSGQGVSGSSWAPWSGGLPYNGNVPSPSLTADQAYGDGLFSLNLGVPGNQCTFYGFQGTNASVTPNTNYRILIRLKTIGITGSGGFTFRPGGGWPNNCASFAGQPVVIPYQTGTEDWHTVTATWNSGTNTFVGDALLTLENVTGGQVYLDEVSMRQDFGGGQFGPEALPRSQFNVQNYFSQEPSWNWDYNLDLQAQNGMYQKVVIEEKQDYVFDAISPYGFGLDIGGQLDHSTGATLLYQQYFWQYLIARWGYSRAIQSWEFANEQAPGDLYMAEQLANYMNTNDPQRHLADTSDWAGITSGPNQYEWQNPAYPDIGYADAHAYVNNGTYSQPTTSWLGTTDPFTGGSMVLDSAQFTSAHSIDQYNKNAAGNKPMIVGEAGIVDGTTAVGQNDSDTQGVWLHQFLWGQLNPGGAYFIYWWTTTIQSNNLYPIFRTYRSFLEGNPTDSVNTRVPLTNGHYQDIQLTLPSGVYGWGQKDTVNGGAHFWIYDNSYNWTNPSGGSAVAGKMVSFSGLPANTYVVQWWDTWLGTYTTQTVSFGGGMMTLTVPAGFPEKDVAVKIFPQTGYLASPTLPPPPPQSFPLQAALSVQK